MEGYDTMAVRTLLIWKIGRTEDRHETWNFKVSNRSWIIRENENEDTET
jgi:hypothetical protein